MPQPTSSRAGEERVTVLVTSHYFDPAFLGGGPIQTLKALIETAPTDFAVVVLCSNYDLGAATPLVRTPDAWLPRAGARVRYSSGGLRATLRPLLQARNADVVYLNSLFNPWYSILPLTLHRLGLWRGAVVLLAPRGELSPGAVELKPVRKRCYLAVARTLGLTRGVVWHASGPAEEDDIRAVFGSEADVVVKEDEVPLDRAAVVRGPRARGRAKLLFASRLDRKKGLLTLLEALADVSAPTSLSIVGAFQDAAYEADCRDALARLPEHVSVELTGALPRDQVMDRMRDADLMVLPTAGENFGHVIAEALSQACPVMCSAHTPWTEWLTSGGGRVVRPNDAATWTARLEEFLAEGADAWESMSRDAAAAFDAWRDADKGRHVFEAIRPLLRRPEQGGGLPGAGPRDRVG